MKKLALLMLLMTINAYAAITCSESNAEGLRTQTHTISALFSTNHLFYEISQTFMTRAGYRTSVNEAIYSLVKIDKEEWKLEKIAGTDWMGTELSLIIVNHSLPGRVCYPNFSCSYFELELKTLNGESIMKCKTEISHGSSL